MSTTNSLSIPPFHPDAFTFIYKHVDGIALSVDVYRPYMFEEPKPTGPQISVAEGPGMLQVPAVVYFHGGGLTVGNKASWFPAWLQRRISSTGCIFISAEYRLMPPSTGHDILADIKDLFRFISHELNSLLQRRYVESVAERTPQCSSTPNFRINANALAVAGTSSGGLCAYLAAMHATPKPRAVLSMYGMGGQFLSSHYVSPKTSVFFRGRELLDPTQFLEYLYPSSRLLAVASDSPLAYHPEISPTPGYPSNPRMLLARLYLQLGVYLDYYTGNHEPSLSATLRELDVRSLNQGKRDEGSRHEAVDLKSMIPAEHLPLFPQFGVTSIWPPTFLVHGAADSAVLVKESEHMYSLLRSNGVDATLRIIEGKEHSFDYEKNADERYGVEGGLFDEVRDFLVACLRDDGSE
ncbi:hypothetical protein AcV5_007799 [Taiwanofungus camphoratus]|nr:hypothetical protein AcW2_007463 [Antrodia cinnamomea]KAI0927201.1 hypothetical protein AcV5_007799 [Antrodia cinnamomea]KAI0947192.1 hypothetical protein AcV7_009680 [Antrodia cinnamomea]